MASEEKQAAIDMDSLGDKQLDQVSAADFLRALNAGGLSLTQYMTVWPEKKKVELFVEPENVGRVRVRDLHRRSIGIAIDCDDFAAETLQLDHHFFAELARAQQHHALSRRRERCSQCRHDGLAARCRKWLMMS